MPDVDHIWKSVRGAPPPVSNPASATAAPATAASLDQLELGELAETLTEALAGLTDRERRIIELRYALDPAIEDPWTYQAIGETSRDFGEELGISIPCPAGSPSADLPSKPPRSGTGGCGAAAPRPGSRARRSQ